MKIQLQCIATFVALALCSACSPELTSELDTPDKDAQTIDNSGDTELTQKPKNIIFILADDLGYGDLGVYGQQKIRTPNLDKLAHEGIMFTDFYAGSTVCAPSRSVLMTGQHVGHTRVRGNGPTEQPLLPEDVTVAEVMKTAGYTTGIIGKWGLGDEGSVGVPNKQGFDYFYGFLNQVHAHNHYPEWLWRNNEKVKLKNVTEPTPVGYSPFIAGVTKPENRKEYAGDLFFQEADGFIRKNKDNPFFLYLAVTTPHANGEASEYDWAHGMEVPSYGVYADTTWPEPQKGYAAMVDHMDKGVGRVVELLKELDIDDDTIVIFTSDNGPHKEAGNKPKFFDSNGPLTGIKRDLYDGGIRVPMIAWAPGFIKPGQVTEQVAYFGDFMATAAQIAGAPTPENTDSISFLPTLTQQSDKQASHEYLYWEFYEWGSRQALRKDNYKAVRQPMFSGPIEIYDLNQDISEQKNIASQHPDLVEQFKQEFKASHIADPNWQIK